MSARQRNKGASAERELFTLLSDELGFVVKRNLSQSRAGGADCIEIPGWSVECKRQEKLNLSAWWQQTIEQCKGSDEPMLCYRQSRKPWLCMVLLSAINPDYNGMPYTATIDFTTACILIRERL